MQLREFVNELGLYNVLLVKLGDAVVPGVDLQGWNNESYVLLDELRRINATSVIELGTWKGASALDIGHALHIAWKDGATKAMPTLLCVDTWLGSAEHIGTGGGHDCYYDIRPIGAFLPLLHQFIVNVHSVYLQDIISAFPATTSVAATVLRRYGVTVDLVYVDASHDYEDVIRDLRNYWPLIRPGGTLIGDDYASEWPGVVEAAERFALEVKFRPEVRGRKYIFRKPTSEQKTKTIMDVTAMDTAFTNAVRI